MFKSMKAKVATAVVVTLSVAANTYAALPTWATTMGTDLTTAVDDVVGAVGPVMVASLVAFITLKLIKRGANKI